MIIISLANNEEGDNLSEPEWSGVRGAGSGPGDPASVPIPKGMFIVPRPWVDEGPPDFGIFTGRYSSEDDAESINREFRAELIVKFCGSEENLQELLADDEAWKKKKEDYELLWFRGSEAEKAAAAGAA
jgi:hypothetical protein